MNNVQLTGNFVKDPEVRVIPIGGKNVAVANFTIASSRPFKKKDGNFDKEVTFVDCEAWDSGAERIGKRYKKGSAILVQGSLRNDKWEDKDGNRRSRLKLRVNSFEPFFVGAPKNNVVNTENALVAASENENGKTPF